MRSHFISRFLQYIPYSLGALTLGIAIADARPSHAFSFLLNSFSTPRITHQIGYDGTGGHYTIDVGIDSSSVFAQEMIVATQNVIETWNNLTPTTGNLDFTELNNNQMDFESVLLHELGHSLGLAHPNLASESRVGRNKRDYTKSGTGANGSFDLNSGADGIIGSADDLRGDDDNKNFFRIADNDPFTTNLGVVDSTTYTRDIALLPSGDNYSANADRDVGAALGYANTESVMQQGAFFGETQRELGADDVAGILYSMSGFDEIAGTDDDYTFELNFVGLTDTADILLAFDNSETSFAESQNSATENLGMNNETGNEHRGITRSSIFFNSNYDWFFPEEEPQNIPEPSSLIGLFAIGLGGFLLRRKQG
ncbi:MAG: PEP-CTERM sorting domain-containing protein [Cyanobacteria bacterium SBLK]|nr:PEP-CTERM sorting domain-containing protein [Cyanobacteria bacterium SBLK]